MSIEPQFGSRSAGVPIGVFLVGSNLVLGNTAVNITGGGVTVGAINVTDAQNLSTTFLIDPAAALGVRNVSVTVGSLPSLDLTFTIIP